MCSFKKRALSDEFIKLWMNGGSLHHLLEAVQNDDTLDLELRGDSVNIYYRGGSLYKITYLKGNVNISFDTNYDISGQGVSDKIDVDKAVDLIPEYKHVMDLWFHKNPRYERECQQLIVRENNYMGEFSKSTDYFIIDIEYENNEEGLNARFDMVALKWPSLSSTRKNINSPSLALIELKYGDGALNNASGISKHLNDLNGFLGSSLFSQFKVDMENVFKQKCKMGLIDGLKDSKHEISIDDTNREVIFIFANHDPDSMRLKNELLQIKTKTYNNIQSLKMASSSFMGYGLYLNKMQFIDEYLNDI